MKLKYTCHISWSDLEGASNTRRHCTACSRDVFNISAMTRQQAQQVIDEHQERGLCVRFVKRDGQIVHKGDPLEQLRSQRTGVRRLLAVALIGQAGFLALSDDPTENYFDPFAAAASTIDETVERMVYERLEERRAEYEMVGF